MERASAISVSTATLLVLVSILLMVVPTAADEYTIPQGGTVFIGEEDLDITATGATSGASLVWYGTGGKISNAPAAQVTVADPQYFYVSSVNFGSKTGPWFLLPENSIAFYVQEPILEVRVVDYSSDFVVSPSSAWIPKGDTVGFRIETNLWVIAQRPDCAGVPLNIRLTGPGNVKYSSLGGYSLEDVVISSSPFETGPIWNTGNAEYSSGNYTVYLDADVIDSQKVTFLLQKDNPLITRTTVIPASSPPSATHSPTPADTVVTSPAMTLQTIAPTTQETLITRATTVAPTTIPGFAGSHVIAAIMTALFLVAIKRRTS